MNNLSVTKCDVCLRIGITTNIRTICNECRKFLCKECSDTHLLHDLSQNHSLINLHPPGEEPRSANKDELVSDFMKQATISEIFVLYHAQVAVESELTSSKRNKIKQKTETKSKQDFDINIAKVKLSKCQEFSVKRPDDVADVNVKGVLTMDDKIIIADSGMKKLKLFDRNGKYLSSTDTEEYQLGITRTDKDKFATCGSGKKVFILTLCENTITKKETYHVDYRWADGIHYNNTCYCVLHRWDNAVTILDRQGRQVRKIVLKEALGKKIEFGQDIHMDNDTHNIYIPCWSENIGVLCMSVKGEALWFTPMSDAALRGITVIRGALCIANCNADKRGLHLMSKTGQYLGKLLEERELVGNPCCVHYKENEHKLYISYTVSSKPDIISVYSRQ